MIDNGCPASQPGGYPSDCELTQALRERAEKRNRPVARSDKWHALLPKAKKIKLLLLDVDGVLTDGTIVYTEDGGESKGFNTKDGFGLRMLQDSGIEVGVITARTSEAVQRRAGDLGFAHLYQGRKDKNDVYDEILKTTGLRPLHTAYMGDDWLDLPLLGRVGLSAAPADAAPEVQQRVDYVCRQNGGRGAVREICDLILEARGQLSMLLAQYGGL